MSNCLLELSLPNRGGGKSRFQRLAIRPAMLAIIVLLIPSADMLAQDVSLLEPQTRQRSSLKPISPSRTTSAKGATFVTLAQGLREVFDGKEPSTLAELKALESQQSLVAKSIEQVTVNVQQGSAQGSGVIVTHDGFVLTAAHVAGGANRDAYVILSDGRRLRARTYGANRGKDAGLLKIIEPSDTPWPYATIGKSSELKIGQWCIASGHPGGWHPERGPVIRVGRILSIIKDGREMEANTLFTDCALIGGDSGGPLFTLEGKLIGIHSRIGTDIVDNMHVPIDVFASSWDRMAEREVWGVLPGFRPVIGVSGDPSSDVPEIASVDPGGPAYKAGVIAGDVVVSINGVKIATFSELQKGVQASMPGDVIVIKVRRGEQVLQFPVRVGVDQSDNT